MDALISQFRPTLISMSMARLCKTTHKDKNVFKRPKLPTLGFFCCKNLWLYCCLCPLRTPTNLSNADFSTSGSRLKQILHSSNDNVFSFFLRRQASFLSKVSISATTGSVQTGILWWIEERKSKRCYCGEGSCALLHVFKNGSRLSCPDCPIKLR